MGSDLWAWFTGTDSAAFRADLDVLRSQIKLGGIKQMVGTGAISDAEGRMLENSVVSLSTAQDPEALKASLEKLIGIMDKSKSRATGKARGTYSTGWAE